MAEHKPVLKSDPWRAEHFFLVCEKCGTVLWSSDMSKCGEQKEPPALGISVSDGVGAKEKIG